MTPAARKRLASAVLAVVGAGLLAWGASRVVGSLVVTRRAVAAYTRLIGAANAGDLDAVRAICSARFLESNRLEVAPGGGVVGLPRNIHRNFQAWRDGGVVLLCPTDRVGPVYRFVPEGGGWKFDGLAGLLRPGGRVEPAAGRDEGGGAGGGDPGAGSADFPRQP